MTANDAIRWFGEYYSQNREDLIIRAFFPEKKDGFYIDVGAHDPDYFSVTKLFYESGWSGINIEPQIAYYKRLQKKRPRDTNLNIGLGGETGTARFREYKKADGLSTVSEQMKDEYSLGGRYKEVAKDYREYDIEISTLTHIYKEYVKGRAVDFLKIDVEGYEREVVAGNDWTKNRPSLLCIESNHEKKNWHGLVSEANYVSVFRDGLNEYFVPRELKEDMMRGFNYADSVLSQISIQSVPFRLFIKELKKQERELKKLNNIILRQDHIIRSLPAESGLKGKLKGSYKRLRPRHKG